MKTLLYFAALVAGMTLIEGGFAGFVGGLLIYIAGHMSGVEDGFKDGLKKGARSVFTKE